MMCWDPSTLTCDGTFTLISYYVIMVGLMIPVDAWCLDEEGGMVWCGHYEMASPWDIWGSTADTCVDMDSLVPPPNSVWLIDVEAVGPGGQSSPSCPGP